MLPSDKHNQIFASKISGKASSLFSNLLNNSSGLAETILNRATKRVFKKLMKKRRALSKGAPWTIAIIIDATIHERSSKKCENSQHFNHGNAYQYGHQWTNVGGYVAGKFIPLPPIPFYTKEYCLKHKKSYLTEADKVAAFIKTVDFKGLLGEHDSSEVVFIMDASYDCKKIQKTIISRKYSFISALKKDRSISIDGVNWVQVQKYFQDGRRPWKTIRVKADSGKMRVFRTKQNA